MNSISGFPEKTGLAQLFRSTILRYHAELAKYHSRSQHNSGKVTATDRRQVASPFNLYTRPYLITLPASLPALVAFRKAQ